MLKDHEIEQLFVELALPEEARQLVRFARANSPVRDANSRLGNSIVWHFSRKMGNRHLEVESRTVEGPAATTYENDPSCLEFWPQPCRVDLVIKDENGKIISRKQHTPDFLLIRQDGIYIHEWREEARLMRLAMESQLFFKDDNGRWHYRPAEDHFANIGLRYELHSALEHPRTYIQNVRFLEDYQSPECPPLPENVETSMLKLVSERGSIPFLELLHEHSYAADNIFKAIVKKSVAVDLHADRLDAPSNLMIHRDMAIARAYRILKHDQTPALPVPGMGRLSAGARLRFDGKDFEVMLVGGGQVLLKDQDGKRMSLPLEDVEALFAKCDIDVISARNPDGTPSKSLAEFSKEQLEIASERLEAITEGGTNKASVRTLQRWGAMMNGAATQLDRLIALVDRNQDKGNRMARLPEKAESLAEEAIRLHYNTPECRTACATYQKYQILCEEHDTRPMSYPTFTKRVKTGCSVKKREGKRKAYQEAAIPLLLDYAFPVHGVRPHDVCYIDHTVMNIATVGPEGSELGKPTFTLVVDGCTTQTRAFYLSYDPPSARSVLMALRDYVRRNNRLPRIIVVDGGKEFRSRELEWFCRRYGIDLRHRPAGMPRGGSPVERAIGATETEVLAKLEGNTRIMKNVRMVTKSVNPFEKAIWTLTALHGALDEYLFEIRDNRIHPSLGSTPRDYEAMRMAETGQREHVLVRLDQNIMLMTSPHTKRWHHKIDRARGVWADNMYYWHDDFRTAKIGEKFEVRIEPWNANVVYVYFRERWVAAIARDLRVLGGRTLREVELALRAERRLAKVNGNKDRLSKVSAKKMVALWSPDKFDERIGKQQREMTHLYSRLGMTVAIPTEVAGTCLSPPLPISAPKVSPGTTHADNFAPAALQVPQVVQTNDASDSNFWRNANGFV